MHHILPRIAYGGVSTRSRACGRQFGSRQFGSDGVVNAELAPVVGTCRWHPHGCGHSHCLRKRADPLRFNFVVGHPYSADRRQGRESARLLRQDARVFRLDKRFGRLQPHWQLSDAIQPTDFQSVVFESLAGITRTGLALLTSSVRGSCGVPEPG